MSALSFRSFIIRASLEALYFSGVHRMVRPLGNSRGVIFTLHRVQPDEPKQAFHPNGILEITPDYLDDVVRHLRSLDIDIVSLDEAVNRLNNPLSRNFACLTFDDGYRDNLDLAYPILKNHNVPFCVYIAPGLIDGRTVPWWIVLEELFRVQDKIVFFGEGLEWDFILKTNTQKHACYYAAWRDLMTGDQYRQRRVINALVKQADLSLSRLLDGLFMSWDDITGLADDPLVTIGAHSINHYALSHLSDDDARHEMAIGADILERYLGEKPRHFSYPYGKVGAADAREFRLAAELGFRSAVTTRPGLLSCAHCSSLMALPRISLNGNFQSLRYLDVLLSGVPTSFYTRVKRLKSEGYQYPSAVST